jgi:hypothetical protein
MAARPMSWTRQMRGHRTRLKGLKAGDCLLCSPATELVSLRWRQVFALVRAD